MRMGLNDPAWTHAEKDGHRVVKIRGGAVKSVADLKKRLKKGGGASYLTRTPSDGSITVRFLAEPEDEKWVEYFEHFDEQRKFYPCSDDCDGCRTGDKPSKRYLTSAVDVQENKVVPLVLPVSAMNSVIKKYDKYGTLLDRDYEISRSGTGFDTEYEVTPEPPTKMNLNRFDTIDLMPLLASQLDDDDDDSDEDSKSTRKKPGRKGPRQDDSKGILDNDDDDDDDEDEDDEDGDDVPPRKSKGKTRPVSKTPASAPAKGKKIIKKRR